MSEKIVIFLTVLRRLSSTPTKLEIKIEIPDLKKFNYTKIYLEFSCIVVLLPLKMVYQAPVAMRIPLIINKFRKR